MKSFLKKVGYWTILLLITDMTYIFMTWLLRPDAMKSTGTFLLLFTVLIIGIGYFLEHRSQQKAVKAMELFLEDPNEASKQSLLTVIDISWHLAINTLYSQLKSQSAAINEKQLDLQNYREYIEAWTHEIKTPLSLATLVLDNHKDEMSPYVYSRMSHVRHKISEDVDRILYYARLQADHVDYKFTKLCLDECVNEVVSDFHALAEEKNVLFQLRLLPLEVVSDKRVLNFILSQLISNAVKYAAQENGMVSISIWQEDNLENKIYLSVRDNGVGISPEDAPFIFDKGFTGNHPDRQKATGMGLYFVKKYAEALSIEVGLEPIIPAISGFGIELIFPRVSFP
jgi:signal transduction histidine kinase